MSESNGRELQVAQGGQLARGFMNPASVKEGMELAAWIAKSDLAPKDYKDKPQNVLIAMQMGLEVGLSPMQSIQNIAVINGRPSIWGDSMLALCQNHRDFESIDENQSTDTKGVCVVKRRGMEAQRREFTIDDAKKAGLWGKQGPWQTAPARMLKLRARAFALRDTFADALRGLQSAEEQKDIVDTTIISTHPHASPKVESVTQTPETVASEPVVNDVPRNETTPDRKITFPQAKRFFAIAKTAGKQDGEIKKYLSTLGIERSADMNLSDYEKAIEWAQTVVDAIELVNEETGEVAP